MFVVFIRTALTGGIAEDTLVSLPARLQLAVNVYGKTLTENG